MSKKAQAVANAKANVDKTTAAARAAGARLSKAGPKEAAAHSRLHHGQEARLEWFDAAVEASNAQKAANEAEAARVAAVKALAEAEALPEE